MIRSEQIPDEVVEAAARAISEFSEPIDKWRYHLPEARAAIAAALAAWPHGAVCHYTIADTEGYEVVLPLPQEASDD